MGQAVGQGDVVAGADRQRGESWALGRLAGADAETLAAVVARVREGCRRERGGEGGGVAGGGTIKVVGGRVAGGRVVPGRPRSAVSNASDVAVRGRSTPKERLRRPTGSAQAVARLRRQPSGWVSAQV